VIGRDRPAATIVGVEAAAFPIVFASVAVAGVALWAASRRLRPLLPGWVWPVYLACVIGVFIAYAIWWTFVP